MTSSLPSSTQSSAIFSQSHTVNWSLSDYRALVTRIPASDSDSTSNVQSDCAIINYEIVYASNEHNLFEVRPNAEIYFKSPEALIFFTAVGETNFTLMAKN